MKTSHILLVILIAALAGFGGAKLAGKMDSPAQQAKAETAYERVIHTKTLRCGFSLWPGSTDRDPNTGKMSGWVPAVAEELGKKLGLKIEWTVEYPLGQGPEMLKSGRVDALCTSDGPWVYTDATLVDWTHPILYYPIYLVIRENETRFKTLADFNKPDVTFSAMDGDISASLHADWTPKAKRLDVSQNGDPSLLALNVDTGKADAVFFDVQTLDRIKKETPIHLKKFSEEPQVILPASFTVRKGETELLQMLNQGFDMLHNLGIIKKLAEEQGLQDAAFLPAMTWQLWEK